MRNRNPLNLYKALPCMSWSPKNLYNVYSRTMGNKKRTIEFESTRSQTLFQQRWRAKAAVRAYHGEYIPEKVFKRWYLPDTIPDVRPRRQVFGDDKNELEEYALRKTKVKQKEREQELEIQEKGLAPVGSLMFSEVERRMDVFLFRCCFVHSVYEARRLIIHGYVKLNGKKHIHAFTRLAPGDMITVDPTAIRFLKPPHGEVDWIIGGPEVKKDSAITDSEGETTSEATKTVSDSQANKVSDIPLSQQITPFHLPLYASPWLYIPAYIEVSFKTCSAVYVRHPSARPGYSEIPTPYDADGPLIRYAWEWYVQRRPRMRSKSQLARMPQDRVVDLEKSIYKDRREFQFSKEAYESKVEWRQGQRKKYEKLSEGLQSEPKTETGKTETGKTKKGKLRA